MAVREYVYNAGESAVLDVVGAMLRISVCTCARGVAESGCGVGCVFQDWVVPT